MTVRRRSRIWTQQPQGPLEIDWSNPLTKGLYIAFDAHSNRDLVSGKFGGYGNAADVVSRYGVGKNNVSVNQLATNVPIPALPLSIIVLTKPVAWGGQQQIYISHGVGGSGGYGFSLPGNSLRFTHYGVADYNATASSWDGSVTDDSQIKCVGCTNNGSSILFYDRGVQIGTSVAVGGYNQGSADIHALTCATQNPQSKEYLALAWSRALSPAEHKLLSENPWQIFARRASRRLISSGGGSSTSLTVQDAQHGHLADSPSFSLDTYLAVVESLHAHTADNVTLTATGTANLVVQEATHTHISEGVVLTTQWLLAIAEALHSHAADNIALSLQTALSVLEALHEHAAGNLTLGITGATNLLIADATSGHAADSLAFSLNTLLAVFDAIHAHAADNLTLDTSNATALTVQDSTHGHGADNLGLSLDTWLSIVDATHSHTADQLTLSTSTALLIAEALHAHYADTVVLGFPSVPGSAPTVEEIVAAVLAALNATTIPVDTRKMNGAPIIGTGLTGDDWRGVGVQPQ